MLSTPVTCAAFLAVLGWSVASAGAPSVPAVGPAVNRTPNAACCFDGAPSTCTDPARLGVCLFDPYCCATAWDSRCVAEFEDATGWLCPPVFDGAYLPSGQAEVGAWDDLVCEASSDGVTQWLVEFDLPTNRTIGVRSPSVFDTRQVWDFGAGFTGGTSSIEILYNAAGVLRGLIRSEDFHDLSGACEQSIGGILFEVQPARVNSCGAAVATPGCDDVWTQTCVCRDDPYCCGFAWDASCVAQAPACEFDVP